MSLNLTMWLQDWQDWLCAVGLNNSDW
uniref:Uncharacterized protein n=1 Tax=Anguilla anguilla TaxID=7936 RepID=A0A0E9RPB6_ANGAN